MATTARRAPTLRYEREAWRSGAGLLAAVDEVGRGALAGPVSVGVVLLSAGAKPAPLGVADSKLLTPQARERLVPRIRRWALDCAVGHASAAEIDRIGIMAALRLAAERAVTQLSVKPDWVLLDGNHDYLSVRDDGLFDRAFDGALGAGDEPDRWRCRVPVRTLIKGDLKCSSIAAASVLAKTERDGIMISLAEKYPQYSFEENKAYSSPQHYAALVEHGPSEIHRCSWNLPGRAGWSAWAGWAGLTERARLAEMADLEELPELLEVPQRHAQTSGPLDTATSDLPDKMTTNYPMGDDEQMMSAGIAR